MKIFIPLLALIILASCSPEVDTEQIEKPFFDQFEEQKSIREVMNRQVEDWNESDVEAFMEGYWKSDSLTFIGSKGLTKGWFTTLNNYKDSYSTPEKMGQLKFDIHEVNVVTSNNAHVLGEWHILRGDSVVEGFFTLVWRKVDQEWVIIQDHSS